MKSYKHNVTFFFVFNFLCLSVFGQNKDIDKGKEILTKAFQQTDAVKKNEMIQKSIELFTKGGMKKELNYIVGDEFLANNDLVQAANYYGRCDKAEKSEGLNKVGTAYVDQAFGDEKNEVKLINNAVKLFTKANTLNTGAKDIGDRYFNRGDKFYAKALDFYFMAKDSVAAESVADTYLTKGGESALEGVTVLQRIGSPSALKKGGDYLFKSKQYDRAYLCYVAGNHTQDLKRVAEVYNQIGKTEEAGNIYVKIAENYMKTANTEAVEKLAQSNVDAMNFSLASRIYDKAGNMSKSKKYLAYSKFMDMDLEGSKELLKEIGEVDLAKAIDANMKYFDNIRYTNMNLLDYVNNQPSVGLETDPETGKFRPLKTDEPILIEYYKGIKDAIVENVLSLSKNITPITNPDLKKMMMKSFLRYPAVGKILNAETFTPKLNKSTAQVKDVYLK